MILGGMNEGVWPGLPRPDPWLAPQIRRLLDLPGLDFRTGLAAHDFMSALGAPRVLLTRARRDGRSPTIASRLWLRLQAMTGGLTRDQRLERLALALDASATTEPATRPAPSPPAEARPGRIAVTDLDRLKADPFAFYARAILRLKKEEPVDAEHHAAWKGIAVHEVLEAWFRQDGCDPAKLRARAEAMIADDAIHPMLRALWSPRLMEAIDWIAREAARDRDCGRMPILAEEFGEAEIAGVTLFGKVDRIDRLPDGALAIVDYKTGKAPAKKAVAEGFALQLGLLALIAREGGFGGIRGEAGAHEYWSLAKKNGRLGYRQSPDEEDPRGFADRAHAHFAEAAGRWLLGEEPFQAKLNPAYAPYEDYDQLMRLEEWYGRQVLTSRVLRLLLQGARPESILCLTFTKAAAAGNGKSRGSAARRLGTAEGERTRGGSSQARRVERSAGPGRRARQLFAKVLDCPGGLKIQTIHAFAQSLLAAFPAERISFRVSSRSKGAPSRSWCEGRSPTSSPTRKVAGDKQLIADVQCLSLRLGEGGAVDYLKACASCHEALAQFGPRETIEPLIRRMMNLPEGSVERVSRRQLRR
jgi:RecB family exonuclease